jgi:hypothetical protein
MNEKTRIKMLETEHSKEFLTLRRAIYLNFIARDAPIKEESLTLNDLCFLIRDVGEDYVRRNKRGLYLRKDER